MFGSSAPHAIVRLDELLERGLRGPIVARRRIPGEATPPYSFLRFGTRSMEMFGVADDWPAGGQEPCDAHILTLRAVRVHSSCGIVVTEDGEAIAETLQRSRPELDGYFRDEPSRITSRITLPASTGRLAGTWLSLLLGDTQDHFRLLLNLARLALLDPSRMATMDGVLLPAELDRVHREAVEAALALAYGRTGPPDGLRVCLVSRGDGLDVERLLLPWQNDLEERISPVGARFLRGLAPHGRHAPGLGRRIYIDRRGTRVRPLLNEDEAVSAMDRLGIEPVRLETLSFAEQMRLMAESDLIVGAHGGGLSNIVFAPTGTRVIEIRPHRLESWRYRSLAAASRLSYDCILSRGVTPLSAPVEHASVVSVDHLLSALDDHLEDVRPPPWARA